MPAESTASILIDGEPTTFRVLVHGDRWIAGTDLGGLFVRLRPDAYPLAAQELVRKDAVEPYVDGWRAPQR